MTNSLLWHFYDVRFAHTVTYVTPLTHSIPSRHPVEPSSLFRIGAWLTGQQGSTAFLVAVTDASVYSHDTCGTAVILASPTHGAH